MKTHGVMAACSVINQARYGGGENQRNETAAAKMAAAK